MDIQLCIVVFLMFIFSILCIVYIFGVRISEKCCYVFMLLISFNLSILCLLEKGSLILRATYFIGFLFLSIVSLLLLCWSLKSMPKNILNNLSERAAASNQYRTPINFPISVPRKNTTQSRYLGFFIPSSLKTASEAAHTSVPIQETNSEGNNSTVEETNENKPAEITGDF